MKNIYLILIGINLFGFAMNLASYIIAESQSAMLGMGFSGMGFMCFLMLYALRDK